MCLRYSDRQVVCFPLKGEGWDTHGHVTHAQKKKSLVNLPQQKDLVCEESELDMPDADILIHAGIDPPQYLARFCVTFFPSKKKAVISFLNVQEAKQYMGRWVYFDERSKNL